MANKYYSLIVTVSAVCGLVQSLICLGLEIWGCLIYLCAVPVAPYVGVADFFRVTFVKLYFEGPKCIPDGSYLGKFNDDYRNADKINLMTPDIIFTVMVVKIVFDLAHVLLCTLLYGANKAKNHRRLLDLVISWSSLVLVMSALDAFLTIQLLLDIFSLTNYMDSQSAYAENGNLRGIQFIPLIFSLASSRVVVFWVWNVGVANYFVISHLCCKRTFDIEESEDTKPETVSVMSTPVQTLRTTETKRFSSSKPRSYKKSHSDWDLYSMEAITRFNEESPGKAPESPVSRETKRFSPEDGAAGKRYLFGYANDDDQSNYEPATSRHWDMTNEGYVSDELDPDDPKINWDFYRKLQKFEEGLKTIKIVKRRVGKPVRVPIPPPLPKSGSFSC